MRTAVLLRLRCEVFAPRVGGLSNSRCYGIEHVRIHSISILVCTVSRVCMYRRRRSRSRVVLDRYNSIFVSNFFRRENNKNKKDDNYSHILPFFRDNFTAVREQIPHAAPES